MDREVVYLGLGANLGDKASNCLHALENLSSTGHNQVRAVSSLYKTEPIGYRDQDWFINCVAEVATSLPPRSLVQHVQGIEKRMGREKRTRWGPRIIDLDILFYGTQVIKEEDLIIPHPRLHERGFVLIPLAELAPDLLHPVLKRTITELTADRKEKDGVELYAPPPLERRG